MSKIFNILIGVIVFCVFFTIMFEMGNQINTKYGVSVSKEYSENTGYYAKIGENAQGEVLNISDKSPGGSEGSVGTPGEDMQIGGIRAMAQIFKAPNNFKNVIFGHNSTDVGLAGKIGIDSRLTQLAVAAVIFTVGLILIGAILRNRI